jgi:hypothetical protein
LRWRPTTRAFFLRDFSPWIRRDSRLNWARLA